VLKTFSTVGGQANMYNALGYENEDGNQVKMLKLGTKMLNQT
jgi:hypothetical protein